MQIVQDMKPVETVVWETYGTPLKALRRIQLWRLCDLHEIRYPHSAPYDLMIQIIEMAKRRQLR